MLATQSDARLVDLVRAGYEPAFEAIVTRYRGALLRYAERFLPRERAEDAVQQSFVSAYEAILRDESALNLRPWLYRIAHNTSLNALRDRGLRHDQLDERVDGVERPDQALERTEGLRDVVAAVQALPERQRDAIVLRELEGRSYDEIASELGVTGGSVRQLLNRARNTLRAGATAVTPIGLLVRIPWSTTTEPAATRVAELCGAAGAGAGVVTAKVCATALVTAAAVGGVAAVPAPDGEKRAAAPDGAAASEESNGRSAAGADVARGGVEGGEGSDTDDAGEDGRDEDDIRRRGGQGGEGDRSGPGGRGERGRSGGEQEDGESGGGQGEGGSGSGGGSSGPGSGSAGSGDGGSARGRGAAPARAPGPAVAARAQGRAAARAPGPGAARAPARAAPPDRNQAPAAPAQAAAAPGRAASTRARVAAARYRGASPSRAAPDPASPEADPRPIPTDEPTRSAASSRAPAYTGPGLRRATTEPGW